MYLIWLQCKKLLVANVKIYNHIPACIGCRLTMQSLCHNSMVSDWIASTFHSFISTIMTDNIRAFTVSKYVLCYTAVMRWTENNTHRSTSRLLCVMHNISSVINPFHDSRPSSLVWFQHSFIAIFYFECICDSKSLSCTKVIMMAA